MNDSILNNHINTAIFQFYIQDAVCRIAVEKMLSNSPEDNNKILSDIILGFHKTFQNNSSVTFSNFSCHGSDIWRIEVCDENGCLLRSIENTYFKGGIQ